jgi:hypothetical protein
MGHQDDFLGGSAPEAPFLHQRPDLPRAGAILRAQPELDASDDALLDEALVAIVRALAALRSAER